jgi:Dolichyl-phosphate-mannose-protein mannosyltransferase
MTDNKTTELPPTAVTQTDSTFDFVPFEGKTQRALSRWFWLQWCVLLAIGFAMLSILTGGFAAVREYGWTADGQSYVSLFAKNEKIFFLALMAMLPLTLALVVGLEDLLARPLLRLRTWLRPVQRRHVLVGLLMVVTALALTASTELVVGNQPMTDDENVYLFQARMMAAGHLTLPSLPDVEPLRERLFEDNVFLVNNGKIFGQYPVGQSIALLPGVMIGYPHLMPILFAVLTVLGMYLLGTRLYGVKAGLAAATLMTISPMFLATASTLLSHTSALCFLVWFYYFAYRTWKEPAWWPALAAGVTFLIAFQIRSTTTLLAGAPFGAALAIALLRRWRENWLKILLLGTLVAGAVLVTFYFNEKINGDILKTNYHAAWGEGRTPFKHPFGFGKGAWHMVHTPEQGFWNLVNNLLRMNWWLLGWPLGLVFVLAWLLRRDKTLLERLGFGTALFSFAVYFFYFWPGVAETGPVLYFELAAILILLTVRGIAAAPRLLLAWMPREVAVRRVTLFVAISCLAAFATFHQYNARSLMRVSDAVGEFGRALAEYGVPEQAVVFTNYYLKNTKDENFQDSWVVGRPPTSRLLGDKQLYYVNYGKERDQQFLAKHHPDLPAFVVSWTPSGKPEVVSLEEYNVLTLPDNFPDSR